MSDAKTQVLSLQAVFERSNPIVADAIKAIRALKDDAFDERILEEDRVFLDLETTGDTGRLTFSLGGAFTSVMAPKAIFEPIILACAFPSRGGKLSTIMFHSNGKITKADGETVIGKDDDKKAYYALPRVIANVVEGLGLKLD